jgi:hypothetical protein
VTTRQVGSNGEKVDHPATYRILRKAVPPFNLYPPNNTGTIDDFSTCVRFPVGLVCQAKSIAKVLYFDPHVAW